MCDTSSDLFDLDLIDLHHQQHLSHSNWFLENKKLMFYFWKKNGILKMLCLYCSSCYHFENQFHISFQNFKKKPSAAKTQQERIQFFGKTIDKHIWRLILYVISANWIEFRFVLFSVVNQNKLIYKSSSVLFVNSCSVFAM